MKFSEWLNPKYTLVAHIEEDADGVKHRTWVVLNNGKFVHQVSDNKAGREYIKRIYGFTDVDFQHSLN